MKRKTFASALGLTLFLSSFAPVSAKNMTTWSQKAIDRAKSQLTAMAKTTDKQNLDSAVFPRTVKENKIKFVGIYDWTSGFFPGSLWYAYELTGDKALGKEARKFTTKLLPLQYYKGIHDVGFMMFCSYGNAIRLAPAKGDTKVLVNTAKSLASRFNPKVGLIKSWDHEPAWKFPVIIDNMMNLELLFEATKMSGDKSFTDIAIRHADVTMKNHFRPDMSTYHVLGYDPETGAVLSKGTHQGYSDASAWARGQAWGLYGYTVCYRYTHDRKYLDWAQKIASFIMANVKTEDKIPYWDYNAPKIPNEPRDASAAAVTASALLELSQLSTNGKAYFGYAEKILKSLSSDKYLAKNGENNGFILLHSVGSFPHNSEVDVPINYADYYYLEGMKRYLDIVKKK